MQKKIIYIDNFLSIHGLTPSVAEFLTPLLRQEGYTIICTSSRKHKLPRLFGMLSTILKHRKNAVALIATYSSDAFYFAYACSLFCRLFGIQYLPFLHGGNLPERIRNSPTLCKQLFCKSVINITVSSYLEKYIHANNWKVQTIPNPINIHLYPFKKRTVCAPKLLWVRSFHVLYNPTLAVKIVHGLKQFYPDILLTMVGPDKDGSLATCRNLAKELNVAENIFFTGMLPRAEWISISEAHDIFINTTDFDNLPVSVIEAMALGMVVISTNVGGLPYLLNDRVNGILLQPNNSKAFEDAIVKVLNYEILAAALSNQARLTAESFDWNNIKPKWNELFRRVL